VEARLLFDENNGHTLTFLPTIPAFLFITPHFESNAYHNDK